MDRKTESNTRRVRGSAFSLVELLVTIVIIVILVGIGLAVGIAVIQSTGNASLAKTVLKNAELIQTEYYTITARNNVNHIGPAPEDWTWLARPHNSPRGTSDFGDELAPEASNTNRKDRQTELQQLSASRFLWVTSDIEELRRLFADFDDETLKDADEDGFLDLVDPWENKIIYVEYVHYGPQDGTGLPLPLGVPDIGNGVVNEHMSDDFLPKSNEPFFASPGPDGKWGYFDPYDNDNSNNDAALPESDVMGFAEGGETAAAQVKARLQTEAADNIYSFDVTGRVTE